MQKIFIKYTFVIVTAAIFLILFFNLIFTFYTLERQQFETFRTKTEQVMHTLENNQTELELMNASLDEDYLTRAKAAAYVLDRMQEVSMDSSQMQYLADLLNVDEVHVIDEKGFIVSSSVSKYIGIDMDDHEQTRAFLAVLDSDKEDAFLIQDAMPNAAENKIMKYVGVARNGQKGVVQVGFEPTRQMEAELRNTYEYLFSKFPTDVGEELFVVDRMTGMVLGHSAGMNREFSADHYQMEQLLNSLEGAFMRGEKGRTMYVVSSAYDDVLICAAIPGEILLHRLVANTFSTFLYLLFVEVAVILLLNYLVRRKVIEGIHHIIEDLSAIANGNLDTRISVGGNREFEQLSDGINHMVKSIVSLSNRISAIIEISGIPLGAFEYKRGRRHVFVTSGVKELLELPGEKAELLYKNASMFDEFIRTLLENSTEEEIDVVRISKSKYVRIHMSETVEGCLGVITDVSGDMMEKRKMQYENTHDPLTGLYQYKHFKRLAADILQKMSSGTICAAVMLDLDSFKEINDVFGHNAGDQYLQGFASVMQSMPQEHFLTARRSGDEFCMMIYDCKKREEIVHWLDTFYKALEAKQIPLSDTQSKCISASGGFAWTTDPDESIYELLSHADKALYDVKKDTKGRYVEYQ